MTLMTFAPLGHSRPASILNGNVHIALVRVVLSREVMLHATHDRQQAANQAEHQQRDQQPGRQAGALRHAAAVDLHKRIPQDLQRCGVVTG
eukprot:CAMPEP_0168492378 /NCGR_PEP_ID=MMETSP0228-20121227/70178_1 /TAXON_ID=133427 /ORGANISM="Protoceratium reticulatum, Strain CCCM 535 (=CCMP 1889)" /LENGTH=90 /DNA_ID=CAMNT_0008509139 /DNA_START=165 /DNA_END=435 /DNA_ORIENTATION=+